jgi:hypothetical protein
MPKTQELSSKIKKELRDYYGFENIKDAYSIYGVNNATEFYNKLNKDYQKEQKRTLKEQAKQNAKKFVAEQAKVQKKKEEEKKVRKEQKKKEEEKKYYKSNVIEYIKSDSPLEDMFNLLKNNYTGKSVVIKVINNGNIVIDRNETIPTSFNDWWKSTGIWIFQVESDKTIWDIYPNCKVYIYLGEKKIETKKIKQYFKEGNVNCLLKPIFKWANDCKENSKSNSAKLRYNAIINKLNKISNEIGDKGVSEDEMIRISNEAQVDISIEKPIIVGEDKYVIETKSNKKPLKKFQVRNTKINHVELNEFLYLNNIEVVSREELYKIREQLENDRTYYEFKRDLNGYSNIVTLEKTWRLSNDFMEFINEMEIEEGLNECYIDDIDNKELSEFVKMATHYNSTIDFSKNRTDAKHMDMKNAYASYKNCGYYQGFLGKITDWRKTDKMEGVGLYQINNLILSSNVKKLNDKMKIYFDNNIYPSCELKWLLDNDCSFNIIYGCWGVKPIDFDMNEYDFLFEKYDGVKGYAKYVGMCDSHYLTKKFSCYGDEELASTLDNCIYYRNNEITIEYPKKHNYHFGHFTAFILSYQRLQMLEQIMQMNYDNLIRICVDGIYYRGDEILRRGFLPKTKMTFENLAGDSYVSNISENEQDWNCGEYKTNHSKELYIGEGGNGKTHKNLLDKGLQRVLYIAPSWKLATKKRLEYGIDSEVWSNILTDDPEKFGSIKRRYNVFVIDEVSMMTEENKINIFNKYDNIKLIFCGDIGYQAPPFSLSDMIPVKEMDTEGFDIIHQEKVNYRYKCDRLKNIISMIRDMITYGRSNIEVNNYVKSMFVKKTNEEIKEMYSINDMILSRSHLIKDTYTEMFKDMEKWYVTKNTRLFKNGEIIIGDKPDTTCEIRHAYTIHSIQGETAEHKLFINMEKCYDSRLLYTAISRARRAEQIILII